MTSRPKLILIFAVAAMSILFGGVWLAGSALSAAERQPVGDLPSDLTGVPVSFKSESGATIDGWLLPGKKGTGAIILMHGVRANRLSMLDRGRLFSRAGYTVLLFDFQAHGESTGERITFGYLESRDAQAAVNFLRAQAPGEKIGVVGISLGGAAASLASPPLDVNAMVLEMVYPTINQAISNRLTMRLGRRSGWLTPLLSYQLRPRLGISSEVLRPIDHVGKLNFPKLFIVGADDQHTTLAESRQMFEAASEPKQLWIVEGVRHDDLHRIAKNEYERRTLDFFGSHLKQQ